MFGCFIIYMKFFFGAGPRRLEVGLLCSLSLPRMCMRVHVLGAVHLRACIGPFL